MKHPLHKKMPFWLDKKIRFRLSLAWLRKQKNTTSFLGGLLVAPALTVMVLFIQSDVLMFRGNFEGLVVQVHAAQKKEAEKAAQTIYHVKRVIEEGDDKGRFVAMVAGDLFQAEKRIDEVETWQHNDTALTLIYSNARPYTFEAFLTVDHEGQLSLHHYGQGESVISAERKLYDDVHDLASLYRSYQSLDRPSLPLLPADATFIRLDKNSNELHFVSSPELNIEIIHIVDATSYLLTREIIYVLDTAGDRYEMTKIAYTERIIVPAAEAERIFSASQYNFELVL